jgi:hypothetical protein
MKSSFENQIYLRCPIIFKNIRANVLSNSIDRGIECRNGWYKLVLDLAAAIEDRASILKNRGIDESALPHVIRVSVSKGQLRFHIENSDSDMNALILAAVKESITICEKCGKPGTRRDESWKDNIIFKYLMQTLCDKCNTA